MESVSQQTVLAALPSDLHRPKIVEQKGNSVVYGERVESALGARITAIGLFIIMCCIPLLFCVDAFVNTQKALWSGVKELKELPAETVKCMLLWHELNSDSRQIGSKDMQVVAVGNPESTRTELKRTWVHSEVLRKAFPDATAGEPLEIETTELGLSVLIGFIYKGMKQIAELPVDNDTKYTQASALMLLATRLNYVDCVEKTLDYLTENIHHSDQLGLNLLSQNIAPYLGATPGESDPIRDKLTAFNILLSPYLTRYG